MSFGRTASPQGGDEPAAARGLRTAAAAKM